MSDIFLGITLAVLLTVMFINMDVAHPDPQAYEPKRKRRRFK